MHLLEQYALSSGLKIGKPFMYEHFFPLPDNKYITLQKEAKFPSRQYKYWQQVVDLLTPILAKNNISIVQIGSSADISLTNVIATSGKTSLAQSHYIIRNSELHLGIDSFGVHVASGLGKKIVGIYSNMSPKNSGPYWSSPNDCILIESPKKNMKPSYAIIEEKHKTINEIKPEKIANSVLLLLKIEEKVKINTLFIGDNFDESTNFGFLANQTITSAKLIPEIRMDLFFNEKGLSDQLSRQKSIITTNKQISHELLMKFKANVAKVIYIIEENDSPDFVKFLFENGFSFNCVSKLDPEKLNLKKISYYRFSKIDEHLETEKEKELKSLLRKSSSENFLFRSNYILSSNAKSYASEQHMLEKESVNDSELSSFLKIKKSELFLNDIKNFWIIEET